MAGVRLLQWPEGRGLGVEVAVTTRHGGVSEGPYESLNLGLHVGDDAERVVANRVRAATALGVELANMVFAEQVHGVGITVVGATDRGRGTTLMDDAVPATDILITTSPDVTMAILVADCVPLALIDPEAGVLAVVHAGWRGTAAGAVAAAMTGMARHGAQPARTTAFIGPAVHPSRYQVDEVVHQELSRAVAPGMLDPDVARPDGVARWVVDLVAANRQQLVMTGIVPERIFESGTSTRDPDYFSDRAERPCGRFALLARLRS